MREKIDARARQRSRHMDNRDCSRQKIAIIGAGAAGVFVAYLLRKFGGDRFEIVLFEKNDRVGGHAHSVAENPGTPHEARFDHGAQFFSEHGQPEYCSMLREEGFFDQNGLIPSAAGGMTIWHASRDELLFKIPSGVTATVLAAIRNPTDWLCFAAFVKQIRSFWDREDWDTSFGAWMKQLDLGFIANQTQKERFERAVIRPLMYQFGLVPPDRLDELSARFVFFFFLGLMPRSLTLSAFEFYTCTEGPDGIMWRLLEKYGLLGKGLRLGAEVRSVAPLGGRHRVATADEVFDADQVVFATNPLFACRMLSGDDESTDLRSELSKMEFTKVKIRIQHPQSPYMPSDARHWSASNVLVIDDDDEIAQHYMLSIWYGAVRKDGVGVDRFKSWGSPHLVPEETEYTTRDHHHDLMVGNPRFMAARDTVRRTHQGRRGLWFAGGYLIDYDSQNAALRSARLVAEKLMISCGVSVPLDRIRFLLRDDELEPKCRFDEKESHPSLPDRFPLIEAVERAVSVFRPLHPDTRAWRRWRRGRSLDALSESEELGSQLYSSAGG